MTPLRHRFLVAAHCERPGGPDPKLRPVLRGCQKVTDNPEHDGPNVLCAHCDTWFPRSQFEVVT